MLRTDNLTSTLSHLSQFQQFLMQQINSINQNDPQTATASLQKSININFDTLRQSLVHCSRIVCHNQSGATAVTLKKKVISLQDEIKKIKLEVRKEIQESCKSAKENAETTCRYLLSSLEKERLIRKQLEDKCVKLTKEKECLMRESS